MEVLIANDYGFGWGSQFGMKYAIDKDLIEFRKKFAYVEWADLAKTVQNIALECDAIGNVAEKDIEKIYECEKNLYDKEELDKVVELLKIIYRIDGYIPYLGGLENLEVRTVPEGAIFTIMEYDGKESIKFLHDFEWVVAN